MWQALPSPLITQHDPWIYGVDGKWLRKQGVVIIHRNITNKENIFWSYHPSESYAAYATDLVMLTALLTTAHYPTGAISDWKGAIVAAVASHFGNIPHQRCLVHVVREVKKLLPKQSPFCATQVLRSIALQLTSITTTREKRAWFVQLIQWEKNHGHFLIEKTIGYDIQRKWWYTHGNVRRAWRLLTHDWNPFFVYLDYPTIPLVNNSLEGTIAQLKNKLINHRGMNTLQQVSFIFWYLAFTRTKTRPELKKLWDAWKKQL